MQYPGGKNHCGTYRAIINQIPPHATFIELFAGSAAIARHMRPAEQTILVDHNPECLKRLPGLPANTIRCRADAIHWLRQVLGEEDRLSSSTFLYADPPYMHVRDYYGGPFSPADHEALLELLLRTPGMVMISGYRNALYNVMLAAWRRIDFEVITRGRTMAVESLWMNYPAPVVLHDPRYAGANYRVRENLARKKRRWKARIERMPSEERQNLLEALCERLSPEEKQALARNLG